MAYQVKYKVDSFISPSDIKLGTKNNIKGAYLVRLDTYTQLVKAKTDIYILSNYDEASSIDGLIRVIYANCFNIVTTQFLVTDTGLRSHFDKFLYKYDWSFFTNGISRTIVDDSKLPIIGYPGSIAFEASKISYVPPTTFNEYYILKSVINALWEDISIDSTKPLEEKLNSLLTFIEYDLEYSEKIKRVLLKLNEEGNINFRRWLITPNNLSNLEYKILFNNLENVIYTEIINTQKAANADTIVSTKYGLDSYDFNRVYKSLNLQLLIGNGAGTILYYYAAIVELLLDIVEQLKVITYKHKVVELFSLGDIPKDELLIVAKLFSEVLSIIYLIDAGDNTSNILNLEEWIQYVMMWANLGELQIYTPKLGLVKPIEFSRELKLQYSSRNTRNISDIVLSLPNNISSKYIDVKCINYTDNPKPLYLSLYCKYNSIIPVIMLLTPNKPTTIRVEALPNSKRGSIYGVIGNKESNTVNYIIKKVGELPNVGFKSS